MTVPVGETVVMTPEWCAPVEADVIEARLSVGGPLALRAEGFVEAASSILSDALLGVSPVIMNASTGRPSATFSILSDANMVVSGNVDMIATQRPQASLLPFFVDGTGDARLSLVQSNLNVAGVDLPASATSILSDAVLAVPPILPVSPSEWPSAMFSILSDARLLIIWPDGAQKYDKDRKFRDTKSFRMRKSVGQVIWRGQALGMFGGIVRPWRPGDPFAGFAGEHGSAVADLMTVFQDGFAELEIAGVVGPVDWSKVVRLVNDDAFMITTDAFITATEQLGRITKHVLARRCDVRFRSFAMRDD